MPPKSFSQAWMDLPQFEMTSKSNWKGVCLHFFHPIVWMSCNAFSPSSREHIERDTLKALRSVSSATRTSMTIAIVQLPLPTHTSTWVPFKKMCEVLVFRFVHYSNTIIIKKWHMITTYCKRDFSRFCTWRKILLTLPWWLNYFDHILPVSLIRLFFYYFRFVLSILWKTVDFLLFSWL